MASIGEATARETPFIQSPSPQAQPTSATLASSMAEHIAAPTTPQEASQTQHQAVEMSNLDTADHGSRPQPPGRFVTATEPTFSEGPPATSHEPQTSTTIVSATDMPTTQSTHDPSAIGPSSETGAPIVVLDAAAPTVLITLLLPSTGTRHPFKIDGPYLKRRNVVSSSPSSPSLAQAIDEAADAAAGERTTSTSDESRGIDPWDISVYTVKELIWRDWRDEWELRPMSPSAIRLIHFGRLLDDKSALRDLKFNPTLPNMIHMSVKPADLDDDETGGKLGKMSSRTSNHRGRRGHHGHAEHDAEQTERTSPGCRCLMM